MAQLSDVKTLYRALDFERELNLDDPADAALYVANLHCDGGISPVDELRANIELSDRPGTWLFTGHRGVGKSTELRRMAHDLRQTGDYDVTVTVYNGIKAAMKLHVEPMAK